jgi:hypothetical protein
LYESKLSANELLDNNSKFTALWNVIEGNLTSSIINDIKKTFIKIDYIKALNSKPQIRRQKRFFNYIYDSKKSLSIRSTTITKKYHKYKQIMEWIDNIEVKFKNLIQILNIGKSIQGRDLRVLRVNQL